MPADICLCTDSSSYCRGTYCPLLVRTLNDFRPPTTPSIDCSLECYKCISARHYYNNNNNFIHVSMYLAKR